MACQLDYLCSLPNDAEKRKALSSLPPGLNPTYERILDRVNNSNESIQRMVQNALQWIVNPIRDVPIPALCHATSIKGGDRILDEEAIYDEEDILMHCSSLIRRSEDGERLEMAHFTVKEFLSAIDPKAHSPYSRYSQVKSFVYPQLAIICLTYLTLDCFGDIVVQDFDSWNAQQHSQYPFPKHAVRSWTRYAKSGWESTSTLEFAKKLFDPSVSTCFLQWARDLIYYEVENLPATNKYFNDFIYYQAGRIQGNDKYFNVVTQYFCAGG